MTASRQAAGLRRYVLAILSCSAAASFLFGNAHYRPSVDANEQLSPLRTTRAQLWSEVYADFTKFVLALLYENRGQLNI